MLRIVPAYSNGEYSTRINDGFNSLSKKPKEASSFKRNLKDRVEGELGDGGSA